MAAASAPKLTWIKTVTDGQSDWRGNRADTGRLAHGLPKPNKINRGVE